MNMFLMQSRVSIEELQEIIEANRDSKEEVMIAKVGDETVIYKKLTLQNVKGKVMFTVYNHECIPVMSLSAIPDVITRYNSLFPTKPEPVALRKENVQ